MEALSKGSHGPILRTSPDKSNTKKWSQPRKWSPWGYNQRLLWERILSQPAGREERRCQALGEAGERGEGEEFQALGREKVPAWLAVNAQQKLLALQVEKAKVEVGVATALGILVIAGCSFAIRRYQKKATA